MLLHNGSDITKHTYLQICRHLAFVQMILPVMQVAWLEKLKTNVNSSVYLRLLHFCFVFLSSLVCERLPYLSSS